MNMTQPPARQLGARGATAAKLFFENLGWGVVETNDHDLGTDLLVQVRDLGMQEMSLMMGVQVKTGDSYLTERATVDEVSGWVFRENNHHHANYWSNHPLPHIILLQSTDMATRVWAYANRDTIKVTSNGRGKGFTIFVPETQELLGGFRDEWVEAAALALKKVSLEGSRWTFDIKEVSSGDHARYALLAPHLVAPHPNKGDSQTILWPEAVALCLLASAEQWVRIAERHAGVPSPEAAKTSTEWGWRFAAAIYDWIYEADISALELLDSGTEPQQWRIAHAVALSIALFDDERTAEAVETLRANVIETEYSAEQGWLSTHLSHLAMEGGDVDEAQRLAKLSNVQLAPVAADVTVSAVRSAAAWAMFDTSNLITMNIGPVVAAMDNATSWWRTQAVAGGLEAAVRRRYSQWSHDRSVIFGAADTAHNLLVSATLGARLSASYAQAKAFASLLGMVDLSTERPGGESPLSALRTLREAGDEKKLRLAIEEIARTGPLADLRELVDGVDPGSMNRTSSRADLTILARAGDFASVSRSEEQIDFLLSALEDPERFSETVSARYLVVPALFDALTGLRSSMNTGHWRRLAAIMATFAKTPDQSAENTLRRLALDSGFDDAGKQTLCDALPEVPTWYRWVLIVALGADHPVAREEIRIGLESGSLDALSALGRYDLLDGEQVDVLTASLTKQLERHRGESSATGIGISSGPDAGRLLASLHINFPTRRGWNALAEFIADDTVPAFRKREAATVLSRHVEAIPDGDVETFRQAVTAAREAEATDVTSDFLGLIPPVGGALDRLQMALLKDGDPQRDAVLLGLLVGDLASRRDAVGYLAHASETETQLASLVNDEDPTVAAEAVAGLARAARRSGSPSDGLMTLLLKFAGEDRMIGLHIAAGLTGDDPLPHALQPVRAVLRQHLSARVRRIAVDLG